MKENFGDQGKRRHCIVAGLMAVAMGSLAAGCRGANEPVAEESATTEVVPDAAVVPTPAIAVSPVGRAELLEAVRAATDEAAAGRPMPADNAALVDRNFELRLPFGCTGEGAAGDIGQWSFDPDTRVLRVRAQPQIWNDDQMIKRLAAGVTYDAAEGFWVERSWTRSEQCPPQVPTGPAPATGQQPAVAGGVAPVHSFALVQYFPPDAPRTLRRGSRPYTYTGKVPIETVLGTKGFRLKLTGRITGFGDGQPIHCAITSQSMPPTCAAAIEVNQVAIEDAGTGEQLAQWGN